MLEHFRGVVWKRDDKPGLFRYTIIGLLVTDRPIEEIKDSEVVLDGGAFGMSDLLACIKQKPAAIRIGDANSVLLNLDRIVEPPEPTVEPKKNRKKKAKE